MSHYVIDASVGIKWFVPEPHAAIARQLLALNHDQLVPDLFFSEIGSIVWKRVRRNEDTVDRAKAIIPALNAIPLQVHSTQLLLSEALEIALQYDRTVYDSLYLALAVRHQCPMVTADQKLCNSLANSPLSSYLQSIETLCL
jgi:predicted nucleic acid-binding protein